MAHRRDCRVLESGLGSGRLQYRQLLDLRACRGMMAAGKGMLTTRESSLDCSKNFAGECQPGAQARAARKCWVKGAGSGKRRAAGRLALWPKCATRRLGSAQLHHLPLQQAPTDLLYPCPSQGGLHFRSLIMISLQTLRPLGPQRVSSLRQRPAPLNTTYSKTWSLAGTSWPSFLRPSVPKHLTATDWAANPAISAQGDGKGPSRAAF
jgi:hypothetical protein